MEIPFATGGEGYGYTEEEWLLKQNLRKFCSEEIAPRYRETFTEDTAANFYRGFIKKLGAAGYFRVSVPEVFGGLGQRLTSQMIVVEEVARADGGLGMYAFAQSMFPCLMGATVPAAFAVYGEKILAGNLIVSMASNSPEG